MNKLDRLYRKALQVVGNKEERERFHRSLRATAVYFDLCSYCYNRGIDMPDLTSDEGMNLIDQLFRLHDYECTLDEFRAWYEDSDRRIVDIDGNLSETVTFTMDYGGGDSYETENEHSYGSQANTGQSSEHGCEWRN